MFYLLLYYQIISAIIDVINIVITIVSIIVIIVFFGQTESS